LETLSQAYKAARILPEYEGQSDALAEVAKAQIEANDIGGALTTAGAIEDKREKVEMLSKIGVALARQVK